MNQALHQGLEQLEQLRLEYHRHRSQGWTFIVILIFAIIGGGLFALTIHPLIAVLLVLLGVIGIGMVHHYWIGRPYESFRQNFKERLVFPLIQTVATEVHYLPAGSEAIMADYAASELYSTGYDRCSVEDTIFCRVGVTDVRFSEIHTEYKTTTKSNGKTETHWHTIFQGILISADFHKHFRGKTFVQADFAEKAFGFLGRTLQKPIFSSLELIQLEDPDFEREFVIRASDQVEARYLLTPKMMQQMTMLKHQFESNVEFSFVDSRMFVAVTTDDDFFEPDASQSVFRVGYIEGVLGQVQLIFGMIDELDLNRRIWTKP